MMEDIFQDGTSREEDELLKAPFGFINDERSGGKSAAVCGVRRCAAVCGPSALAGSILDPREVRFFDGAGTIEEFRNRSTTNWRSVTVTL
jgi:hypothetical protein